MKWHSISVVMVTALFQSLAAAPAVSISGTVKKSGGGALKDVTCTLAGVSGLSSTTDASGMFALSNGPAAVNPFAGAQQLTFNLNGKELFIHGADKEISGTVSVYSTEGKRVSSVSFKQANGSSGAIALPSFSAGLNILRITVNGMTYTSSLLQLPSSSARLQYSQSASA